MHHFAAFVLDAQNDSNITNTLSLLVIGNLIDETVRNQLESALTATQGNDSSSPSASIPQGTQSHDQCQLCKRAWQLRERHACFMYVSAECLITAAQLYMHESKSLSLHVQILGAQTAALGTCAADKVACDEACDEGSGGESEMARPPAQRVICSRSEAYSRLYGGPSPEEDDLGSL